MPVIPSKYPIRSHRGSGSRTSVSRNIFFPDLLPSLSLQTLSDPLFGQGMK